MNNACRDFYGDAGESHDQSNTPGSRSRPALLKELVDITRAIPCKTLDEPGASQSFIEQEDASLSRYLTDIELSIKKLGSDVKKEASRSWKLGDEEAHRCLVPCLVSCLHYTCKSGDAGTPDYEFSPV